MASTMAMAQDIKAGEADEIITIGRRNNMIIDDVAGSIAVVNHKRLEEELVTNMSEVFLQEPGISVTGDVGGAQNINVRGMSSDRILMIKDGMRLNEGYGADGLNDIVGRGFLETDNLAQVEVAKGPYSSLYGSDALGGVVVFRTKDAAMYLEDDDNTYMAVRSGYSGRSNEYKVGGTAAFRTGKFETLVNYTYRDGGLYKRGDTDTDDGSVISHAILGKTRLNLNEHDKIDFSVEYYNQKFDLPDNGQDHGNWLNLPGFKIIAKTAADEKESTSARLNYTSDREAGLYDYIDVAGYYQETKQSDEDFLGLQIDSPFTAYVGPRDMTNSNVYTQKTFGFTSSLTKEFNTDNTIQTLGYGLDFDTTETSRSRKQFRIQGTNVIRDSTTYPFPTNDTLRIGAYVFDEFELASGKLRVTPGARWDYYKLTPDGGETAIIDFDEISESHISPNLGIIYDLSDDFTLFGQFSEGFKVPPYDLAYIFLDQSFYRYKLIPADEDIRPETSRAFEAGIRGGSGAFTGSISAYLTDYDDFISISAVGTEPNLIYGTGVTNIFQYGNIEAVTIKGIEGKISYEADNGLNLFANAALQTGRDDNTDEYITTISPLNGTFGVSYDFGSVRANAVVRWADGMSKVNADKQESKGFTVLDLTASWEPMDRFKVRAGVQNVLDKNYTQYSSVAGLDDGQDLSLRSRAGRTASITAELEF